MSGLSAVDGLIARITAPPGLVWIAVMISAPGYQSGVFSGGSQTRAYHLVMAMALHSCYPRRNTLQYLKPVNHYTNEYKEG